MGAFFCPYAPDSPYLSQIQFYTVSRVNPSVLSCAGQNAYLFTGCAPLSGQMGLTRAVIVFIIWKKCGVITQRLVRGVNDESVTLFGTRFRRLRRDSNGPLEWK